MQLNEIFEEKMAQINLLKLNNVPFPIDVF